MANKTGRTNIFLKFYWKYLSKPRNFVRQHIYLCYSNYRINQIRKKPQINVMFIVAELGAWKTESLYNAMNEHPRFRPIIGVTTSQEVPGSKEVLVEYLESKKIDYVDLDVNPYLIESLNIDIKFYYKPYDNSYPANIFFDKHLRSLVCFINYGFHMGGDYDAFYHKIRRYSWKCFLENEEVFRTMSSVRGLYLKNCVITGIPIQDFLIKDKSYFTNPWKQCGDKKRIIYAPHHSLKGTNGNFIEYSTFLEFGDFILGMAKKYSDKIQWAFKPHPTLYPKLVKMWGKSRTDQYYNEWRNLNNTQIELGEYMGLFKHSDAMIHDCSSFLVEYMYTEKPVLFLEERQHTPEEMHLGKFSYDSYMSHYHASTYEQIETFISNVLDGNDNMKQKRDYYFKKYLVPSGNRTACGNIINVILGE